MKRFNFSLQKILQLRKYREEESKIELGRAIGVLSEIENRIKTNASTRVSAAAQRFADAGNSAAMAAWEHYIIRLDQEAEKLVKEAAQAELVVEEKRAIYLEASRKLKAIEKLREKREKEHRKKMFAAETAELDSISGRKRVEDFST